MRLIKALTDLAGRRNFNEELGEAMNTIETRPKFVYSPKDKALKRKTLKIDKRQSMRLFFITQLKIPSRSRNLFIILDF